MTFQALKATVSNARQAKVEAAIIAQNIGTDEVAVTFTGTDQIEQLFDWIG